jgi:replication-associated recombination protein RarA
MDTHPLSLSEQLRPRKLEDFILPERIRVVLNRFIEAKTTMNLTFYGSPGTGKTSAARFLAEEFDANTLDFSKHKSGRSAVKEIRDSASSMSLVFKRKLWIIDEADMMSTSTQELLRFEIDNYQNCRFLLTTNRLEKISDAIQSRCLPVQFDLTPKERAEMRPHVICFFEKKFSSLNIRYDRERLERIIDANFPDYRKIIERIEFQSFGIPEKIEIAS